MLDPLEQELVARLNELELIREVQVLSRYCVNTRVTYPDGDGLPME